MGFLHIKRAIEHDERILSYLSLRTSRLEWQSFTRSHFNYISNYINSFITEKVIEDPRLVLESLIIGKDFYYSLSEKYEFRTIEDFTDFLITHKNKLPFSWISGKTIQSYWNNGEPKQLKLNVLLVFLNISQKEWDNWKYGTPQITVDQVGVENTGLPSEYNVLKNSSYHNILSKYYTGSYHLYYVNTNNNNKIVKAPFIIKEEDGAIIAETCTEGHRYRSFPAKIIQRNIYFLCKNLDWDEFETHLINIGLETKPEILFGVSIALTVKEGLPVGIKNVFVKQSADINILKEVEEKTIDLNQNESDEEESVVLNYFKQQQNSIHYANHCRSFEDLKNFVNNKDN